MKSIYSMSLEQLTDEMVNLGQSKYRSKQIFLWLYQKHATSFDEMTDISKSFREVLKERYDFSLPSPSFRQESRD